MSEQSLHIAVVWLDMGLLALLVSGLTALRKSLAEPLRDSGSPHLGLLALLAALHFIFLKPLIPHAGWHEQHALGLIAGVDSNLYRGGLDLLHGPTYSLVLLLLKTLTGGIVSLFSLNYLIALAAVFVFFLWVRLFSGDEDLALCAGSLLLFLPGHIRLSTTESMFVLVEFLILLSLLLVSIYIKTRDRRHLVLAGTSLLLLMHARAEMLLLGPVILGGYFFLLRPRGLRGAGLVASAVCLAAAAACLAVPRAVLLLMGGDPRISQPAPTEVLAHLTRYYRLGLTGTNAFFQPEYTPILYILLFLAGTIHLFRQNKRLSLYLHSHWLLTSYFYIVHLSCVSLKIRTSLVSQYVFVLLAAYGFKFLPRKAAAAVLAVALVSAPVFCRAFLGTLYTQQQERLFLQEAGERLPDNAVVAYLAEEDEANVIQNREYQAWLLDPAKTRRILGLKEFHETPLPMEDAFYYEGVPCFMPPWFSDRIISKAVPKFYFHPFCRGMRMTYELQPVTQTLVQGKSLSWDRVRGAGAPVGLYRIMGKRVY